MTSIYGLVAMALALHLLGGEVLARESTVRLDSGAVRGISDVSGVLVFKGIPFAAPPVGQLRWRPPAPVMPWRGVRNADAYAPACMQAVGPSRIRSEAEYRELFLPLSLPPAEDCLYLNVWTSSRSGRRPVVVWIHGGGWTNGSPAVPASDGARLARKGIVVVSVNYRLGPFGFLSHPELTTESVHGSSGNYGILDQLAALEWVRRNIAAFGGDPMNVTIAGQSAGALSANALLASPLAQGLFRRVVAESGSLIVRNAALVDGRTRAEMERVGQALAQAMGAGSLAEMRAASAEDVLSAASRVPSPAGPFGPPFGPVIDGWVLPADVGSLMTTAPQRNLQLLIGWNGDDGEAVAPPALTVDSFRGLADFTAGGRSREFLERYPAASDQEARASATAFFTDYFAMQTRTWAQLANSHQSRVFVYQFARVPADAACRCAFHAAEIPYIFGNVARSARAYDATDRKLSEVLASYFVNFAKRGDPNGAGLPRWPAYDRTDEQIAVVGDRVEAARMPRTGFLDFVRTLLTTR